MRIVLADGNALVYSVDAVEISLSQGYGREAIHVRREPGVMPCVSCAYHQKWGDDRRGVHLSDRAGERLEDWPVGG